MKLAGEFEFLGDAYPGQPEFDAAPPDGVVKLVYPGAERCGFFQCAPARWAAFKEAASHLHPNLAARGDYPNATFEAP